MEALICVGRPGQVWDYEASRFVNADWLAKQAWYTISYLMPSWPGCPPYEARQQRRAAFFEAVQEYAAKEAQRIGALSFEIQRKKLAV
jgi:hypothetical protein